MPPANLAFVKLDGIGDFVLATSLLRFIQKRAPAAQATLFVRQPVGELARQQFPRWEVVELPARGRPLRHLLLELETRHRLTGLPAFDLLVDLRAYRGFADSVMSSWIPARCKVAVENQLARATPRSAIPREASLYDHLLPPIAAGGAAPEDQGAYLALAQFLFPDETIGPGDLRPALAATAAAQAALGERLAAECGFDPRRPFLLVCPGARATIREYPAERLATAIAGVLDRHPLPVVLAGGAADRNLAGAVAAQLAGRGPATDLTGKLSLSEHATLTSLARVTVAMETASAHIACALGVPGVALIGGGHYGLFAPWGESPTFRWLTNRVPCFGCNWRCIYDRPICILDIVPAAVAEAVLGVMAAGETRNLNPDT